MKKNRDVNKDTIKIISDYGCDEANLNGPTKQRSLWVSFPCISAIKVTQRFYDIIIKNAITHALLCNWMFKYSLQLKNKLSIASITQPFETCFLPGELAE